MQPPLGRLEHVADGGADGLDRDPAGRAGGSYRVDMTTRRLGKDQRPARPLRQRRARGEAGEIGLVEHHPQRCWRDAAGQQPLGDRRVHGHHAAYRGERRRRVVPGAEVVADEHRRHVREARQCRRRGRQVVRVDHVELAAERDDVIDHRHRPGADLLGDGAEPRRVHHRAMARGHQRLGEIARDDLGAGARIEPQVGEEDAQGARATAHAPARHAVSARSNGSR